MRRIFVALCLTACATFAAAQAGSKKVEPQFRPDFSGSWVLKKVDRGGRSVGTTLDAPDLSRSAPPDRVVYKDSLPQQPDTRTPKPTPEPEETLKITHHDPELRIVRSVINKGERSEREETFFTDGRGESNLVGREAENSKTFWDGERVVIVSSHAISFQMGNKVVRNEFISNHSWELSNDGKTLTEKRVTKHSDGGTVAEVKLIYKRKS